MTDLIEILREEAKWGNTYSGEILARIEKLEEERDNAKYLFQQYFQLSREASDESDARIEKLEAALRELSTDWDCCNVSKAMRAIARQALEGKDD